MRRTKNILTLRKGFSFFIEVMLFAILLPIFSANSADNVIYRQTDKNAEIVMPLAPKDDYNVETKGRNLTISFNRAIAKNLADAPQQLNKFIKGKNISTDGKSITFTAFFPVNARNKIEKGNLIINITRKPVGKNADDSGKNIKVSYGNHDKFTRFVFDYTQKPTYTIKANNLRTIVSFMDDIRLQTDGIKNYPKKGKIEKNANRLGGIDFNIPERLLQSFEYKNKLVLDFAKSEEEPAVEKSTTKKQNIVTKTTLANTFQENNTKAKDEVASLGFSWNVPVGVAVFQRGDYIWVVFDHHRMVDIEDIRKQSAKVVDEVVQIPHNMGTVFRFKPKKNVKVSLRQEGLLWIIDLYTHNVPYKIRELPIFTQYNSVGQSYLFVATPHAGTVISVVDPEIGDVILAAPNVELGVGISEDYKYPDLEILPSKQGFAIVPNVSDMILSRGNTGFSIKGDNRGLNISEDLDTLKRQQALGQDSSWEEFDLYVPPQLLKLSFNAAEEQLKTDILNAIPDKKAEARLQLAKYYVAMGLGSNALKTLNAIKASKEPIAKSEKYYALHGVANFLMERYDEAIDDFSQGKLPEMNEAVFWRTLSSSAIEFKKENNIVLFSFISIIKDYSKELKERIALIAADTAIKAHDDISTQNYMDVLKDTKRGIDRKAHIAYLNAQKSELQGYPRNALREYGNIIPMNTQKFSSLARYAKKSLELKLKLTSLDSAIAEFERLRYAWGEPKFKLKLLDSLADVYAQNKNYYSALKTYKESLVIASSSQREEIINKMVRLFEDIYMNNRADDMQALKALALYKDFEWLAPKSKHYTDIAQKLADRLVAVDLLPRAVDMLKEQLLFVNLSDIQKAQIGTRLALIYLFQSDNIASLDILDDTKSDNLPLNLSQYRKIIRARALSALNKNDEALEVLKGDTSKNALLLKSDIYWKTGKWDKVSDTIKYLIEKPQKEKPLSEEQINYILDWATALKKAGRETVIVRLRNKFLPYFAKTPYHSTFNVLTNNLETDKIDIKAINQAVNDVAAYSNFSKLYNKSLRDATLSPTDK